MVLDNTTALIILWSILGISFIQVIWEISKISRQNSEIKRGEKLLKDGRYSEAFKLFCLLTKNFRIMKDVSKANTMRGNLQTLHHIQQQLEFASTKLNYTISFKPLSESINELVEYLTKFKDTQLVDTSFTRGFGQIINSINHTLSGPSNEESTQVRLKIEKIIKEREELLAECKRVSRLDHI